MTEPLLELRGVNKSFGAVHVLRGVDLDEDDPRRQALEVYGWLGWLQESLISCLVPRRS